MATCTTCSNLRPPILSTLPVGKWTGLFFTVSDLKSSIATTSCAECRLIWDALSCYKSTWDEKDLTQYIELKVAVGKQCQVFWRRDGVYVELFSRRDGESVPEIPDTIGTVKEVAEESSSDSCFELASTWLKTCVDSHPACRSEALQALPTRVIDVGVAGTRDPFLVESQGQSGKYVALSYCWGDPRFHNVLKTTADTYKKHLERIDFSAMPRTLQDAVTITRRLAIQYLWIDALCIIQGDADDWARESSKMCDVYSNAHLTIAGDNSPGNSHGILNKQSFGVPPKEVKYKDSTVYIRKQLGREHDNFSMIGRGPVPEPINCRGWCLQEAVLSNRLLRYTSKELFWECNEWRNCECGHSSEPIEEDDEASSRSVRKPEIFGTLSPPELRQSWNDIIMKFTERQLGYDEDKLPALSGLANQFAKVQGLATEEKDEYLAGHWRSNLAISLLWNVEDDRSRDMRDKEIVYRRPKVWRAPSWSWAAVEGPVTYIPLRHFRSCLEIMQVTTVPSTLDPYGKIEEDSGKLVVRGRVVHGFSVKVEEMQEGGTYEGYIAGKRYALWRGEHTRTILPDDGVNEMNIAGVEKLSGKVTCLLVGVVELPGAGREDFFLVLKKGAGDLNMYVRIGVSLRRYLHHRANESNDDSVDGLFRSAVEEEITIC
ncbi:heterokaryon incompatibility protein-domain-containing protein [Leptodontidium sp. 2 PMI_412]|nr:heterokaryon incompatibility protein-domain-containing protein [Leptodontidium sp. 2 PMI_412]